MNATSLQEKYFESVTYCDPMRPAVAAYADPKVQFIQQRVLLKGRVSNVGCGNDMFTSRFASAGAVVTGLGYSRYLLKQNSHPDLIYVNVLALPFADRQFDVVLEANILHHVSDRELIRERETDSLAHPLSRQRRGVCFALK